MSLTSVSCVKKTKKRRKHINFKIEIKTKEDIMVFTEFLEKDIQKRLIIDKKRYFLDNTLCHIKHLNFILMEIILHEVLTLFEEDIENKIQGNNAAIEKEDILYVPEKTYEKDETAISRVDIMNKYKKINDRKFIHEVSSYIYKKYKVFEYLNLNFIKRKIYEFI